MISIVILLLLALVNLAAAWKYPPLLVNAGALAALVAIAWAEVRRQRQPSSG